MAAPTVPPPMPDPEQPWLSYPAGVYPPPPNTGRPYPTSSPSTAGKRYGFAALTLVGGLLLCTGSFMPWITTYDNQGTYNLDGLGGGARDGILTLPLGCLLIGISIARFAAEVPVWIQRSTLVLGSAGVLMAVVDMNQIVAGMNYYIQQHNLQDSYVGGYTGAGLTMVLIGSIIAAIGGMGVDCPAFVPPKPFVTPEVTKRPLAPWFPAGTEAWVVGLVLVITVAVVLWTGWVVTL